MVQTPLKSRSALAPAGLLWRGLEVPADLPKLETILQACHQVDDLEGVPMADELMRLSQPQANYDPARDVIVAELQGEVVAFGSLRWAHSNDGTIIFTHAGYVTPGCRNRGVGRALLEALQARSQAIAASLPVTDIKVLNVRIPSTSKAEAALLLEDGYRPVHTALFMIRPDLSGVPDLPIPFGFELRPAQPEHYREIWEASQEAFSENWGVVEETEEDYQKWIKESTFAPASWQVAWTVGRGSRSQVAGMVLPLVDEPENLNFGRMRAYTENVCVRKPYRRLGLARALLAATLRKLKTMGFTEAALYVDATNVNAAPHLYEEMGYQTIKSFINYQKEM